MIHWSMKKPEIKNFLTLSFYALNWFPRCLLCPEHEFVNFKEPRNRFPAWRAWMTTYLKYRPARLHIGWRNRFLDSFNVCTFGLSSGVRLRHSRPDEYGRRRSLHSVCTISPCSVQGTYTTHELKQSRLPRYSTEMVSWSGDPYTYVPYFLRS